MSNTWYPKYKEALLAGLLDLDLLQTDADNAPYIALVTVDDGGYVYSADDRYYDDLGDNVVVEKQLTSLTVTDGVFNAADVNFPALAGGKCDGIVLYRRNSGSSDTWVLVAYLDTGYTNLPLTPDGTDVNITWDINGIIGL